MREFTFWRWTISPERPAIVHVQREAIAERTQVGAISGETETSTTLSRDESTPRYAAGEARRAVATPALLNLVRHNVYKPGQFAPIINNLELTFEGGRTYFIVGVNGVGKTLFLKSLTRASTTVRLHKGDTRAAALIGYVASRQRICDEPLTVQQLLTLANAHEGLTSWSLDSCRWRRVQGLSQGEKTRLALAIAEASNPTALLLDEPTIGLDDEALDRLRRLLHRRRADGLITILASHELILYQDEGGELLLFEHDHERTRVVRATERILHAEADVQLGDDKLELRGALPEIARVALEIQKRRLAEDRE